MHATPSGRFHAHAYRDGKQFFFGAFDTAEAAALGVAAGAGLSLFVAMATGSAMVVLRMPRRAVGRRAARDFERDSIPPKDVEPDP